MRMSFLILRLLDLQQKHKVNKNTERHSGGGLQLRFHSTENFTNSASVEIDPEMLISTAFFEYVDRFYYAHEHTKRFLHMDGDIEAFALLLSTPLPQDAIDSLQLDSQNSDGTAIDKSATFDITVVDIIGHKPTTKLHHPECFSLLKYSFNLTPALREEISKDLAAMITEHEPQITSGFSLPPNCIERKQTYLAKIVENPRDPPAGPSGLESKGDDEDAVQSSE